MPGTSGKKRKSPSNDDESEYLAAALAALNARGAEFLQSAGLIAPPTKKRKEDIEESSDSDSASSSEDYDGYDEWEGVGDPGSLQNASDLQSGSAQASGKKVSSGENSVSGRNYSPPTVVFASTLPPKEPSQSSGPLSKSFMSSKVNKIHASKTGNVKGRATESQESEDEDGSHAINDRELHKLIHTRVLLGSQQSELKLTPAQRRKAMEGRVLELANSAKLGEGDKTVRQNEKNKAAKHVRDGMKSRQRERDAKELEEAKNLGNYHPVFKKLFAGSSAKKGLKRKRERGIGMGVGKFAGGQLNLSRQEIAQVTGTSGSNKTKRR
ncbi:hypothetical protein FRC03_009263 [Tulasnella sp. 419]|nr:hypothetical protein FRC03_009263 [Tulasnella sp. 419]